MQGQGWERAGAGPRARLERMLFPLGVCSHLENNKNNKKLKKIN